MASGSVRLSGKVEYIPSGGSAVLRQSGVVALLRSQAEAAAGRCNSMAHLSNASQPPRYAAAPKSLRWVTGYTVSAANDEAGIDNLKHNTLKKGCGV